MARTTTRIHGMGSRIGPLLLLIIAGGLVLACRSAPRKPQPFVFDQEFVLTTSQTDKLDSLFWAHEKRTGNEIALVTSATFNGKSALYFAVDFGDSLGVGKKDRDNGVTIAYSKALRKVFIATGYGTERVLHDSICQRVIDDSMLPLFKVDDTFGGLWAGATAIVDFLDRPENAIR